MMFGFRSKGEEFSEKPGRLGSIPRLTDKSIYILKH